MRSWVWRLALLTTAIACACGGTAPSPVSHQSLALGTPDAGHTTHVRVGDSVVVTLQDEYPVPGSSLVWNVTTPDSSILEAGMTTRSPQVKSGPGGHDTYTAVFRAIAAGQAVLDAHGTTSCEAMAKQNCPDRDFTITVVVS
jgi:predicted secreted protein